MTTDMDFAAAGIAPVAFEEWTVRIQADKVHICRMGLQGRPVESYRIVDRATAALWLVAISQGFAPPRDLRRLDTPAD